MQTKPQDRGETLGADEHTDAGSRDSLDDNHTDVSQRSANLSRSGEDKLERVDRFRLDRVLGSGGMGTVYEGWDEKLQRRVALKLLRRTSNPSKSERRFFREAQGLARISHPNVVPVYDVGRWNERVWIAMEFVPGQTLGEWVAGSKRSQAEILDKWLGLGRGLAAIHDCGLIHRDIKPSNVLVGEDGRVRIIDFGLVKAADTQHDPGESTEATLDSGSDHLSGSLTEIRGFMGTPGYAAPEQQDGRPIDACSDQFSFCVGLWEALCGARPPRTERERSGLVPLPEGVRLAKRLHHALSRGLALEPRDRFADMHALLVELAPRQRKWLAPAAAATLTAILAGGVAVAVMPDGDVAPVLPDPCASAASEIEGVWTAQRRDHLAEQMDSAVSARATALVDEWASSWSSAATTSCEDVHVRQIYSEQAQDLRTMCLARSLDSLSAFMLAVDQGDVTTTHALIEWMSQLRDPKACLGEAVLRTTYRSAAQESDDEVATLRQQLIGIGVAGTRDYQQRIQVAERVRERAKQLGAEQLLGEAQLALGLLRTKTYELATARSELGRALDIATMRHDAELGADAWSALFVIEAKLALDRPRAAWMLERQAALFEEVDPGPRRRARMLTDRAHYLWLDSRLVQAEETLREALALYESIGLSASWERADTMHTLGWVLSTMGRSEAALEAYEAARTIELDSAAGGGREVSAAKDAINEAIALIEGQKYAQAHVRAREGLDLAIAQQGPRGDMVANFHLVIAAACDGLGDHDCVRVHAEQADAISRLNHSPDDLARIDVLSGVGVAAFNDGRPEAAVAAFEQALTIAQRHTAADSIQIGYAEANLAEALHAMGQDLRAYSLASHALQILEPQNPDNHRLVPVLMLAAELELGSDNPEAARRKLERAATLAAESDGETRRKIDELIARCEKRAPD
jgi:tetratricopeptide (TPR) repeat protein/predicted Ser/Thr protein kinase